MNSQYCVNSINKGPLPSLKQLLTIENPLKMKNAFFVMLNALFVFEIFPCLL